MKYILGALVALYVTSTTFAQTGNTAVDYGIQAGTELAQAIADSDFKRTMGKLATKIGPYLGMAGPAIGILFSILGSEQDSPELTYMRRMFDRMEIRFSQIDDKLDNIANMIDWNSINCAFRDHELNIRDLQNSLDQFYRATNNNSAYSYREIFVHKYRNDYNGAAFKIFDAINNNLLTTGNVITKVIRIYDYDRKDIQVFMLGITKLIIQGSQIEMAYYKFEHPHVLNDQKTIWTNRMNDMRRTMVDADRKVVDDYNTAAKNDALKIVRDYSNQSNGRIADKIFDKLKRKYYWRNWFVAVYDPISGFDNHCITYCSGGHQFRYHGHNLWYASNPKDTSVIGNMDSIFRSVPRILITAEEIYHEVKNAVSPCSDYSAFGVIRRNADVAIRSHHDRLKAHEIRFHGILRYTFGSGFMMFMFR